NLELETIPVSERLRWNQRNFGCEKLDFSHTAERFEQYLPLALKLTVVGHVLKITPATIAEVGAWRNHPPGSSLYDLDRLSFQVSSALAKVVNHYPGSGQPQRNKSAISRLEVKTM